MNSKLIQNVLRAAGWHALPALMVAATLVAAQADAQQQVDGRAYGQPSECFPGSPASLGLYLTQVAGQVPALRLEGGTPGAPALLLFANEAGDCSLPGGGRLLVGALATVVDGNFDEHGVFLWALTGAQFDAANDQVFAQGVQPMTRLSAMEFSAGMQLRRQHVECAPPRPEPAVPDEILVEEFAGMMTAGHMEAALDLALNSTGDALTLDLAGNLELPVAPGVTVGGKAAFQAKIERGEDSFGNPVYDVVIAADVAATCGVGCAIAGANISSGQGLEVIWRYASTHEVARALRSTAILQAVGPRLELACLLLDTQLENIDRGVDLARDSADRARAAARSRLPGQDNARLQQLQRHQDKARKERREAADRAREVVGRLISWVATERIFLLTHFHGYETHNTLALDGNVSTPVISGANLGFNAAAGVVALVGMRVERVPESEAMFVEHVMTLTGSKSIALGNTIGGALSSQRVLELRRRLQIGADGLQLADSGTTVRVTADGKLLAALGSIVSGQAAVAGEVAFEMRLADLLAYSQDAIAILTGDDDQRVLALLRAFPIRFSVQGRYEAGLAVGLGLDIDGIFKAGIGGRATMVDCGPSFEYVGGSGSQCDRGESLLRELVEALREGPVQRAREAMQSRLVGVCDEVTSVMQR